MFRRSPTPAGDVDPLITADLPERVRIAQSRLPHQDDPSLLEAKSVTELAADRKVAERLRAHERTERLADVEAAEVTAAQVRKATTSIVRADARDLMLSRQALADHRRQDSPHAQLAHLFKVKKWSGRALAGVVVVAMLYSAVNVQHNLAPGGPSDPLYWASYLLEALISTVLVVFMVSGSAVARWGITERDDVIRWTEGLLLAGSIALNTFPYFERTEWFNIGAHGVAPVMIGVALVGHEAVARRLGLAIAAASATVPAGDDTAERLAALGRVATIAQSIAPAAPGEDETAQEEPIAGDPRATDMVEFEREFDRSRATEPVPACDDEPAREKPIAREDEPAREDECATDLARATADRAPIARDEDAVPRASKDTPPTETDDEPAREETEETPVPVAHTDATEDRAPIAAQTPAELDTDRESIAAQSDHIAPAEDAAAGEVPSDRRAVVALVRDARPARGTDRAPRTGRAPVAREAAVDGALARAADRAPRATFAAREGEASGPFARELSRAEAMRLARAVSDQGRSRQPVETLARIYLERSHGHTPNRIGEIVGLPHSTVGRALAAALQVAGPRALG